MLKMLMLSLMLTANVKVMAKEPVQSESNYKVMASDIIEYLCTNVYVHMNPNACAEAYVQCLNIGMAQRILHYCDEKPCTMEQQVFNILVGCAMQEPASI